MADPCDPCTCPEMFYKDSLSWRKAMIQLLCDIEASIVAAEVNFPGGLLHSVLFIEPAGTISQDNADFNYNSTTNKLSLNGPLDLGGNINFTSTGIGLQSNGTVPIRMFITAATWNSDALAQGNTPLVINNNGIGVGPHMVLINTGNDANQGLIELYKTRSTGLDANTIIQNGDILFDINFGGADGVTYRRAATLRAVVDGVPGAADMPGRLEIGTTPDGSNAPLRRWYVDSAGVLQQDATNGSNFVFNKLGTGIKVKEGANAKMGQATLINGAVTVSTTAVHTTSEILFSVASPIGALGALSKQAVVEATSFNIISSSAIDNSIISWFILDPS